MIGEVQGWKGLECKIGIVGGGLVSKKKKGGRRGVVEGVVL